MSNFKHALGEKAKDLITGFEGIIIYRVDYQTGCNQYGLQPPIDSKGVVPESKQFDENRIEIKKGKGIFLSLSEKPKERGGPNSPISFTNKNIKS